MKNAYLLFLILFVLFFSGAEKSSNLLSSYPAKINKASETNSNKDLQGAWTSSFTDEDGEKIKVTTIVMDGYLAETFYTVKTNKFIRTFGGSWTVDKDNSRVGASLSFNYEIIENEWHHSGMSSKGKHIYEIWSPRILPDKNTD